MQEHSHIKVSLNCGHMSTKESDPLTAPRDIAQEGFLKTATI
jgi:hypothetical protein